MKRSPYKNKKDQLKELVFYFDIKDEQQGEGGTLLSVSAKFTTIQFRVKGLYIKVLLNVSYVPRAGIEPTSKP